MESRKKKRVAFFDFACCGGCQLAVLELEETLLDLLGHTDIAAWREVMTGDHPPYDVAFCEGSVASARDEKRLRRIRRDSRVLVALGSCAAIGCHNMLRNGMGAGKALTAVYGRSAPNMDSTDARPVSAVVETDYRVLGCPVSLPEFVSVFQAVVADQPFRPSEDPVCVECKLADALCVYEKGRVCLGPLTRCGCQAVCTRCGDVCHGCRGLVEDANLAALRRVFARDRLHPLMQAVVDRHPLDEDRLLGMVGIYNGSQELELKDRQGRDDS